MYSYTEAAIFFVLGSLCILAGAIVKVDFIVTLCIVAIGVASAMHGILVAWRVFNAPRL